MVRPQQQADKLFGTLISQSVQDYLSIPVRNTSIYTNL